MCGAFSPKVEVALLLPPTDNPIGIAFLSAWRARQGHDQSESPVCGGVSLLCFLIKTMKRRVRLYPFADQFIIISKYARALQREKKIYQTLMKNENENVIYLFILFSLFVKF
jgi:hypothetical protein